MNKTERFEGVALIVCSASEAQVLKSVLSIFCERGDVVALD